MKRLAIATGLLLAACSSHGNDNAAAPANAAAPTAPVAAHPQDGQKHGDDLAAPSPEALLAQAEAQRYFDLLARRDYRGAYRLWNGDGADTRGSAADFERSFAAYARYRGTAGRPTPVKAEGATQYVLIESHVDAALRRGNQAKPLDGVLMMKRAAKPGATPGPWRIWGADIRPRRCKKGETPRGLGCDS